MQDLVRRTLRVVLSSHVASGAVAASGVLLISVAVSAFLGEAAGAAATVGVIIATPADQPAPKHGKFTHLLPAAVIGTPLFLLVQLAREVPVALPILLVVATFFAFLGAAWGKRGLPISISVMLSMIFALAAPRAPDFEAALHGTIAFSLGAALYLLWGTLANAVLNPRYRVLSVVDSLQAVAALMRTQAVQFTMPPGSPLQASVVGRLMKEQAALADQLQTSRNLLLESPRTARRLQLAGMLMQILDMRDHLVACSLDLESLRALPEHQELLRVLGGEIQALSRDLDELADAMLIGQAPAPFTHERPAIASAASAASAAMAVPDGSALQAPSPQLLASAMSRRVGYVHDEVSRLVGLARGEREPDVNVVRTAWQLFVSPTSWSWRPFLTLWRWDAPPLRHAIRAALAIGAGQAVAMLLPWGSHAYWILLTIVVVLRGSLAQTLERRNSRVAGTLLGCVLAGALLYAHAPPALLLLAVALGQGVAHAFAIRRYIITAIAATVLALLQAHLLNPGASPVFEVAERVMDTLLGVGIAWLFSYVLPSWERTQIGALVDRALAAQTKHAQLALALGQLRTVDDKAELAWRLARREAYDSLSALVQAVQRSLSEPRAVRPPLQELERLLGHSYRLLAHLTAVKTMLLQRRDRLDIEQLQAPLAQASEAIAVALSSGGGSASTPAQDDMSGMLDVPDPFERDLSPWLLRRLRLAVSIAQELKGEAQRAVSPQAASA